MDKASEDRVSVDVVGEAPGPPRRRPFPPPAWLISGGLLMLLAILTVNVLVHGPLTGLDERIRAAVLARAAAPGWQWLGDTPHRPAQLLTDLGMTTLAVPVLAAVALALAIRRHTFRPVLIALTGVALLFATVIPAKIIIGLPGPGCRRSCPGSWVSSVRAHVHRARCLSLAVAMLVARSRPAIRYPALAPWRCSGWRSGPRSCGVTTTGSRMWSRAGPCPGC